MNLALAIGRLDTPLARLDSARPLVRAEHVIHIGSRDEGEPYGNVSLGRRESSISHNGYSAQRASTKL